MNKLLLDSRLSAKIINGKSLAGKLLDNLKTNINTLYNQHNIRPGLAIVQIECPNESNAYVRNKLKIANELGIVTKLVKYNKDIDKRQLIDKILELNNEKDIHGIIVQLTYDAHSRDLQNEALDYIDPTKDVDGLHYVNAGKLSIGRLNDTFIPCTPKGCLELIKSTGVQLSGANAVVVGASRLVGLPMSNLLRLNNSTVTICHSKTKNLESICKTADILVVAIGCPKFITSKYIKENSVVIDVGITYDEKSKKISGDVDFNNVVDKVRYITPVPGGVGPMTIAMLMENTYEAALRSNRIKMSEP